MGYENTSLYIIDNKSGSVKNRRIKFIFQFCMLFFFISEFPIYGFLTSRRLVAVVALSYLLFNNRKVIHLFRYFKINKIGLYILLFYFVILLILINSVIYPQNNSNVYFEYWYIIYQFLYVFIIGLYCIISFRCFKKFAQTLVAVFLFQSIAVLLAVLNAEVRIFLYNNFYFSDNRFDDAVLKWGTRIVGVNLHSSTGSVYMSTGCLALIFLKIKNEIKDFPFYFYIIMIMLGTAFVGRLGLLIEIIGLIAFFIIERKSIKKILSVIFVVVFFIVLINVILGQLNPVISEHYSAWITGAFNGSGFKGVSNAINRIQATPEFSSNWIFGCGVTFGTTPSGEKMYNDSGYVKSLVSIGIFGSLAYYLANYSLLTAPRWNVNKKVKALMRLIILLVFIIEYKEPFIMKYIFTFFAFVCGGFCAKEGK